jgi:hypothetical protein
VGVTPNNLSGKSDSATKTNREVLSQYLDVPILGVFPHMEHTEVMDRSLLSDIVEKNINVTPLV